MKRRLLINDIINLIIILIPIFVSCGENGNMHLLEEADKIMESEPDSAFSLIEKIDASTIKGNKERARYALLRTQALIKTRHVVTDDSLINIALEYYKNHGSDFDRMRTNFYSSIIDCNNGHYNEAMPKVIKAKEIARRKGDIFWQGKINHQAGVVFTYTFNHKEAVRTIREAAELFRTADKDEHYYFALLDLANSMFNNNEDSWEIIDIVNKVLSEAKDKEYYDMLKNYSYSILKPVYYYRGEYAKADSIYNLIDSSFFEFDKENRVYNQTQNIVIDVNLGRKEKAKKSWEEINPASLNDSQKVGYFRASKIMALSDGDYITANVYADSLINLLISKSRESLNDTPLLIERNYYDSQAANEAKKKILFRTIAVTLLIFLIFLTVFSYIIYKMKIKIRDLEISNLTENVNQLEKENKEIAELLFRNKNSAYNFICDQFYETYDPEGNNKIMIANLYKQIEALKGRGNLKNIELSVDENLNGVAKKLREQCKFLNSKDLMFIILLFAGFNARAVCLILNLAKKNFYTKRSRLQERIKSSDVPDKALFLKYMS